MADLWRDRLHALIQREIHAGREVQSRRDQVVNAQVLLAKCERDLESAVKETDIHLRQRVFGESVQP